MAKLVEDTLKTAISSGTAYLRQKLLSGQYGLACLGLNGQPKFSNDKGHLFSIFHLVNALNGEMTEIERTIFLTRILSEEYNGQWGYSPRGYYKQEGENPFFTDADDTSFALRTLRALNVYRSNEVLMQYLSSFQLKGGTKHPAFTTFVFNLPGRELTSSPTFANNAQIHPEVNANVYHTLLDSHLDKWICPELIKLSQKEDGSWSSYFYPNAYYATWQFMSLLQKTSQQQECFNRGMEFLLKTQNENGSWGVANDPYLSSLALKSLNLGVQTEPVERAVAYILSCQGNDGSWTTPEKIWTFHDNEGDVWQAFDTNRVIGTALCVDALKDFMEKHKW